MNDEELRRLLRRSDGPIVIRPLHAPRPRLTFGKLAAVMSLGAAAAIVSLVIGTALGNWRDQGPKEGEPHAAAASIDPSAGKTGLLAEIPVEHVPTSVAVLPFENRLFVADRDGGLSAFDAATNRLVNRVVLPLSGPVPAKITAIPSTKRVYVTDFSGDRVLVIDGLTLDVIATVPTGRAPTAITSDAKANRIYVANLGLQSARVDQSVPGSVTVIDGGGSVLATVPTHGHPITLDVSPGVNSNRLYVGALGLPGESSFIQVIDTFTKSEVASVVVAAPSALVADPVDNAVYAVTPFQAAPLGSKLIELDARTNVAATSVVDSPGDARAIGWHPGSDDRYRRIYVASQTDLGGILHIYRTLPGTIRLSEVGVVRVGAEPVALAVDGASHRVYVASAKTISVVLQGPEPTTPTIPSQSASPSVASTPPRTSRAAWTSTTATVSDALARFRAAGLKVETRPTGNEGILFGADRVELFLIQGETVAIYTFPSTTASGRVLDDAANFRLTVSYLRTPYYVQVANLLVVITTNDPKAAATAIEALTRS
jgi:YVTN family beta-propeller protein